MSCCVKKLEPKQQQSQHDTIYDLDKHYQLSETDATLSWSPEEFGGRQIGLAVVGVGRMGAIHMYNVLREPRAKLLFVVDASQDRLNYMKRKYFLDERGIRTLNIEQWDVVLKDKKVEAILISTPTFTHEKYVRSGLEHGKHILCEKPLAGDINSVRSLVKLADDKKLNLICALNRRYDPSFRTIKHQSKRGDIGNLRIIKCCSRDSPGPPLEYIRTSGGIFHDCCVHDIDIILWLAEELPVEVQAYAHTYDPDYIKLNDFDTAVVTIKFKSGLIGVVDLSRVSAAGYEIRVEIFGPKGVLKVDEAPRVNSEKHNEIGVTRPNQCYSFASRFQEAYALEITELFNHIEGYKTLEEKNVKYLPALCKITHAAEESARSGKSVKLSWTDEEQCF